MLRKMFRLACHCVRPTFSKHVFFPFLFRWRLNKIFAKSFSYQFVFKIVFRKRKFINGCNFDAMNVNWSCLQLNLRWLKELAHKVATAITFNYSGYHFHFTASGLIKKCENRKASLLAANDMRCVSYAAPRKSFFLFKILLLEVLGDCVVCGIDFVLAMNELSFLIETSFKVIIHYFLSKMW